MKALPDVLLVVGALMASWGAYLIHPAAGFITIGILLILTGLKVSK